MAAKSKNRLPKIENKLLKLDKLELKDVLCPICQSILIEPVTLPCFHDFCQHCFSGSVEYNALCCPLCRLRIGSWLRTATKHKNLVNVQLWNFIKSKFPAEVTKKTNGEDIDLPEETPLPRLSAQGEIRSEYEAEVKRLKIERLERERKQLLETELLINKIKQEEEEAEKKNLERLKQDEMLAQEIQNEQLQIPEPQPSTPRRSIRNTPRPRLKATKIDKYLKINTAKVKNSPFLPEDNTSSDSCMSKTTTVSTSTSTSSGSPEMVPRYGRKNVVDKKVKLGTNLWNKENGDSSKEKKDDTEAAAKEKEDKGKGKRKNAGPSLLVSLPLPCIPGIPQQKPQVPDRNVDSISVDSMEELCFFKPIKRTTVTKVSAGKGFPLRIPSVHADKKPSLSPEPPPTRDQYLEALCNLRSLSLSNNLPSAFVLTLDILKNETEDLDKYEANLKSKAKKESNKSKVTKQVDGITKLNNETNLRRTRSVSSITKDENETTPKKSKVKQRKVSSERKPRLKSNTKKVNPSNEHSSPLLMTESINNNRVNLAVKNLSSPLDNCDVKEILQEQIRVKNLLEQEKSDFELARKIEAEWNSRRLPRRAAIKRQVTVNYPLRPTKKLKV
ncbi:hypothetical protein O3G_MSEX007701 [Manduca sexta]|uniref:RING-type E3 ubiquitin transferase n=1 Tax=Manduca sexta TaxID=7130 RepID=A0A921Z7Z8_MANSE|nr:hypothetical protein O3G_MSEX007701 [Manduca sexta]